MSGFGRRVVDPKPVLRNADGYGNKDLDAAWNQMNRAKTLMRRTEFNLREAEHPPLDDTNPTQHSFVSMDRVPKYSIDRQNISEEVIVDKYGRTNHMKAKLGEANRKVSRLEDKYREPEEVYVERRNRSPLREPNHPPVSEYNLSRRPHEFSSSDPFSKRLHRDEDPLPQRSIADSYRQKYKPIDLDTTSSTAVRETDINFLNDISTRHQRHEAREPKLSHVDIRVPSKKYSSSNGHVGNPTKVAGRSEFIGATRKDNIGVNGNVTDESKGNDTFTKSGSSDCSNENEGPWRKKVSFKGTDKHEEGLARVREMVRKQRMTQSSGDLQPTREVSAEEQAPELPKRSLHLDSEPIVSRKYELYDKEATSAPARKIAVGLKAPSYRGFSETETKYQMSEAKIVKTAEVKRKKPAPPPPPIVQPQAQTSPPLNQPPVPRRNPRDHRKTAGDSKDQEKKAEPKKMTRVVAPKSSNTDLITTHSWREGQKAILKELGPRKIRKPPQVPSLREGDQPHSDHDDGFRAINIDSIQDARDFEPRPQRSVPETRKLKDGAQDVILETKAEHSDSDGDNLQQKDPRSRSRSSSQPRRKRTKTAENEVAERQQPKTKHYVSSDVRKYMAKQKADRKRKQQEEEHHRKLFEENKTKHLEELYRKQKESAKQPCKVRSGPEIGVRFKLEDPEKMYSRKDVRMEHSGGESDKENRHGPRQFRGADASESDSSTLTEAAIEPDLPPSPPVRLRRDPDGMNKLQQPSHKKDKSDVDRDLLMKKYLSGSDPDEAFQEPPKVPPKSAPKTWDLDTHQKAGDIIAKLTQETGMSVEDIVQKHYKKAEVIGKTYSRRDPSITTPLSAIPEPDLRPAEIIKPLPIAGASRLDRIQAIKNTCSSLQSRIKESERLVTQERWAEPRHENPDFVSRYQRMTGHKDDYAVFDRDLPGVRNLTNTAVRAEDQRFETSAATKIQAAFRGHTVRQSLTWQVPEHKFVDVNRHRPEIKGHFTSDSEGLSDSLMTDDSVSEDNYIFKKPQALPPRLADPSGKLRPSKPIPSWDHPKPDPYSVLNTYSKKYKQQKLRALPPVPVDVSDDDQRMAHLAQGRSSKSNEDRSRYKSLRTRSPDSLASDLKSSTSEDDMATDSYQDDFTGGTSMHKSTGQGSARPYPDRSSRSRDDQRLHPSGKLSDHEDDSLNDTLTESFASDVDMKEESRLSLVPSCVSLTKSDKDSEWSDVSSLTDESDVAHPVYKQYPSYHESKFSPALLDHQMMVDLNNLQTIEESLRQLTDVERVRSVSLAQQETVSLAQVLKAQQIQAREVAEIKRKSQQESMDTARQLEEAQRRAAEATQALTQVRVEGIRSNDEATRRLIETQTEVAQATAQAARHLQDIKGGNERYSSQLIKDTASAAAVSAVQATLPLYQARQQTIAKQDHSTQYSVREPSPYSRTDGTDYSRTDVTSEYTRTEDPTASYTSESFESYTKSSPRVKKDGSAKQSEVSRSTSSAEVKTAEDLSQTYEGLASTVKTASISTASDMSQENRKSPDSSIQTESGLKDGDLSRTESVLEELGSERDYTIEIETEEEMERSMREVLPSEGQRKKLQRQTSREELAYMSSDDLLMTPTSSRRLSFGEESFSRFSIEMANLYLKDEETRAKHQSALLKLREQALVDKTKAELAWLDQQKKSMRSKGADDTYPQIKQKQRGVIRKLQKEQAEIKRMKEKHKAASRERQMILKQSKEINKLRKSTQEIQNRLIKTTDGSENRTGPVAARIRTSTPDDLRLNLLDGSESSPSSPSKEKHDSEVQESFHKMKLMKLDRKYSSLTSRERKLQERRERAEEMIAWKERLDEEEARILEIEREMVDLNRMKERQGKGKSKDRSYEMIEAADTLQLTTPDQVSRKASRSNYSEKPDTARSIPESIYSEKPDTARSIPESLYSEKPDTARSIPESIYSEKPDTIRSIQESIYSEKPDTARSIPTESGYTDRPDTARSIPESIYSEKPDTARSSKSGYTSIGEEITSTVQSTVRSRSQVRSVSDASIPEERTHDETEINSSVNEDYSNETFETTERTQTQTHTGVSKSNNTPSATPRHKNRLPKFAKENGFGIGSLQISPTNNNLRKNSESESEDSFSVAASEASDASDVENRIRNLTSELKHRKMEAERLKRENHRRRKEKLRQKEEHLLQQIENYDKYIHQYKKDANRSPEILERHLSPVRPQIKPPPAKSNVKVTERASSVDRPRSETEGASRTSLAVSFEDNRATISTQGTDASPLKQLPQPTTKTRQPMSKTSAAPRRIPTPPTTPEPHTATDLKSDVTDNIPEDILASKTDRPDQSELMLQLGNDDRDDKVPPVTPRSARDSRMDSARSIPEIPEDYSMDTARSDVSESRQESGRLKLIINNDRNKSEASEVKEEVLSARSDASHASANSELSDRSASQRSESTTRSYSTTKSDRTTERSVSYEDDYSEDSASYSSATVSTKTPSKKSVVSEKSLQKSTHVSEKEEKDEVDEGTHTQDDISEAITEEPVEEEESKSSEGMLQVTAVVKERPREPLEDFKVGDRVAVQHLGIGTLLFIGFTKFTPGYQAGVDLDKAVGSNDGSVDGTTYFRCSQNHGVFVTADKLSVAPKDTSPSPKVVAEREEDDVLATSLESEMEKIISNASQSVEGFFDIDDAKSEKQDTDIPADIEEALSYVSEPRPPCTTDATERQESAVSQKETKKDTVLNLAVENLLNEAISQMVIIRNRKKDISEQTDLPNEASKPNTVVVPKASSPVEEEVQEPGHDESSDGEDGLLERPSAALDHLPDIGSPTEFMDEDMYNFDTDVDDPWNDDDLGFGIGSKPTSTVDKHAALTHLDLKLDLQKLSEDVVVPHKEEEVTTIVDQTIDFFWERRRYGESWHGVDFPASLLASDDKGASTEAKSRRVYKRLIFDLTSQVLCDMYREEEEDDDLQGAWSKQRLPKRKYHKGKSPPTTVNILRPIVENHVKQVMGLTQKDSLWRGHGQKWGARKKKDRVDQLLVQELREDEPQWVNYNDDELAVKNQITDTLFENLLFDTVKALGPAIHSWSEAKS